MMNATSPETESPSMPTLAALVAAEAACRRCPLYRNATQVVPGEGPPAASVMLVGEQPGDREDLAGHPFVGPAGAVLDRALADAGIERTQVFVTNAVKHFKFGMRGKRRLHKRPNAYEIDRCRWWLEHERLLVRPAVLVALGATAARSLWGRPLSVGAVRGRDLRLEDGTPAFVTIHPSFLLRIREQRDRAREYRRFVADLQAAVAAAPRNAA